MVDGTTELVVLADGEVVVVVEDRVPVEEVAADEVATELDVVDETVLEVATLEEAAELDDVAEVLEVVFTATMLPTALPTQAFQFVTPF